MSSWRVPFRPFPFLLPLVRSAVAASLLLSAACGDSTITDDDTRPSDDDFAPVDMGSRDLGGELDGTTPPPSDMSARDTNAPPGSERFVLVEGDWSLGGGREEYRCVRTTIDRELFVSEFHPIAPLGTHHTVVTYVESPTRPDGITSCHASENDPDMIYGSGVGTEPLVMPEGVAVRIPAGAQVLVNLHLYNTSGDELSGRSGLEVVTVPVESVEHEAQVLLAGTVNISIPPRSNDYSTTGRCTMNSDTTVFAVMPHMHQYGSAMTVRHGDTILHEDLYSFDNQVYYPIEPQLELSTGDRVDVTCQYMNNTDRSIGFGDSSEQEMCFALLYRYPPVDEGNGIYCIL